jgi:hypothetical protein
MALASGIETYTMSIRSSTNTKDDDLKQLCHLLDLETSMVLLLGSSHRLMSEQFRIISSVGMHFAKRLNEMLLLSSANVDIFFENHGCDVLYKIGEHFHRDPAAGEQILKSIAIISEKAAEDEQQTRIQAMIKSGLVRLTIDCCEHLVHSEPASVSGIRALIALHRYGSPKVRRFLRLMGVGGVVYDISRAHTTSENVRMAVDDLKALPEFGESPPSASGFCCFLVAAANAPTVF